MQVYFNISPSKIELGISQLNTQAHTVRINSKDALDDLLLNASVSCFSSITTDN